MKDWNVRPLRGTPQGGTITQEKLSMESQRSLLPIVVVATATKLPPESAGAVVVAGSHAAVFTIYLSARANAFAAIHHDASIGRDEAGVSGLAWADAFGMPAVAIDGRTARIGDGDDMMRAGRVSRFNQAAAALGVTAAMSCREAAELLASVARDAPKPQWVFDAPAETRSVYQENQDGTRIVCMDSIALAVAEDRDQILATGSHGGLPSAQYSSKIHPKLVLFNDAGFGPDNAGVAALPLLDAEGIAAVAVASESARIGDGRSTLLDGRISAANQAAKQLGAQLGLAAIDVARRVAGHRP